MPNEPKDEAITPEDTPAVENYESSPEPQETPQEPAAPEATPISDAPVEAPVEPIPQPESPVVAAPTPIATPEPKKKSKKPLIIGLIVAGVAALLIGGGVLAYNFWYQNPNKVVGDALVNAITAKTLSATGFIELETDDYRVKVEVAGKSNLDANASVAVKLSYATDDINVTVDGEGIYSADGDIYVKLNDAQDLAASIEEQSNGQVSFEAFDEVIEKVDSKWVKIGRDDLGEVSEEYERVQKCFADISNQLDEDTAFRRSVEDEVKNLYSEHQFIIVGDKLGSRTINGQGSLGYMLSADPAVADTFFTEFADTQLGKKFQECDDDIAFDKIVSDSEKKDDGTETHAEIWVSRFGHTITELNLHADEDGTKGVIVVNPVFNKNEAIEIPTDVIPFSELKADIEKAYTDYYASYYESYYSGSTSGSGSDVEFN